MAQMTKFTIREGFCESVCMGLYKMVYKVVGNRVSSTAHFNSLGDDIWITPGS